MIIKKENKEEKTQSLRRKLSCSKIQQFIAEAFNILWYKSGKHIFFLKKEPILAYLAVRNTHIESERLDTYSQTGEEFCVQFLKVPFQRKFYWLVVFS